jgi:ABC-type polysaccharide/polyol phosphate transport system ATPase subunit
MREEIARYQVRLERVGKSFVPETPAVFTRQERLARLLRVLRGVFAPRHMQMLNGRADLLHRAPKMALTDISLTIPAGAVLGIAGEAGSGKTTMLRLLAGLDRPTSGSVTLRGRVAGVFTLAEGGCHRKLSVQENIALASIRQGMPRGWLKHHCAAIAEEAQLGSALQTPLSEIPCAAYEQLAWALALSSRPDILLLDEMVFGNSAQLRDAVFREVAARRKAGQSTVVAGSTPEVLAPLCTHLAVLSQGRLLDHGTTFDVMARLPGASSEHAAEDVIRDWYWIVSPRDGWAAYFFLRPKDADTWLARGHTLLPATPPWVDEQGRCALEPWQCHAGTPSTASQR